MALRNRELHARNDDDEKEEERKMLTTEMSWLRKILRERK